MDTPNPMDQFDLPDAADPTEVLAPILPEAVDGPLGIPVLVPSVAKNALEGNGPSIPNPYDD